MLQHGYMQNCSAFWHFLICIKYHLQGLLWNLLIAFLLPFWSLPLYKSPAITCLNNEAQTYFPFLPMAEFRTTLVKREYFPMISENTSFLIIPIMKFGKWVFLLMASGEVLRCTANWWIPPSHQTSSVLLSFLKFGILGILTKQRLYIYSWNVWRHTSLTLKEQVEASRYVQEIQSHYLPPFPMYSYSCTVWWTELVLFLMGVCCGHHSLTRARALRTHPQTSLSHLPYKRHC